MNIIWTNKENTNESPYQACKRLLNYEIINRNLIPTKKSISFGNTLYKYPYTDKEDIIVWYKPDITEIYLESK